MLRSLRLALLVAIVALLAACGGAQGQPTAAPTAASAPTATTLRVTDALGRQVTLAGAPARIVSLAPSVTETLFAIGAGPQIVGVTSFCNYPPEADALPEVGGFSANTIRGLVALGLETQRGALPFLLARSGDGAATRAALLRRGCLLRDCASFGLPAWVRVAPRRPAENAHLLAAWADALADH